MRGVDCTLKYVPTVEGEGEGEGEGEDTFCKSKVKL